MPSALLETIAIDEDNIDVLIDDGFLDAKDICTGQYATACQKAGLE